MIQANKRVHGLEKQIGLAKRCIGAPLVVKLFLRQPRSTRTVTVKKINVLVSCDNKSLYKYACKPVQNYERS